MSAAAIKREPLGPWDWGTALVVALVLSFLLLPGCAPKQPIVPPSAPPAVEVLVPIAKPCEVQKVEPSPLATVGGVPNEIFEAVKRVLADREVLLGDRKRLMAANSDPCPEVQP